MSERPVAARERHPASGAQHASSSAQRLTWVASGGDGRGDGHRQPLRAVVRSCYDGDTCRVDLVGDPPLFGENLPGRLPDVDTAELRGTDAACKALARAAPVTGCGSWWSAVT